MRLLLFLFAFTTMTFHSCTLKSQVTGPIEVVDGKPYYMHKVEKGQTLFSLSKIYKCELEEIIAANPGSENGIKDGSIIKIPSTKSKLNTGEVKTEGEKSYLMHEVKKKETLFSLSKFYKVDINALMAANPGSQDGLKKGAVLRIPVPTTKTKVEESNNITHLVVAGETLYSISKKYGITEKAITDLNPVAASGLKTGQELKIPGKMDTSIIDKPIDLEKKSGPVDASSFRDVYHIALMLPFNTNVRDSAGLSDKEKKLQDVALNLYRGCSMAADSLEAAGLSAELQVYDVPEGSAAVSRILGKSEMKNTDLIIGPTFRDALHEVATWSTREQKHLVCPVPQNNKILLSSPYISKMIPGSATEWESLAAHIFKTHKNDNVILINSINVEDTRQVQVFRSGWIKAGGDSIMNELKVSTRSASGLRDKLHATKTNVVVCPSNDHLLITSLLKAINKSDRIILYGTSEWENMDFIEPEQREDFHIRFAQSTFADYTSSKVQTWVESYRAMYKTEPSEFAFIGYDLMMYYGLGLKNFGVSFPEHFNEIDQQKLIAHGFQMQKTGVESGYENQFIFVTESIMSDEEED